MTNLIFFSHSLGARQAHQAPLATPVITTHYTATERGEMQEQKQSIERVTINGLKIEHLC